MGGWPGGGAGAGAGAAAAAVLFFLRRHRKNAANPRAPRSARPPTTPPAIAPTFVLLPEGGGGGGAGSDAAGGAVEEAVSDTDEEGCSLELIVVEASEDAGTCEEESKPGRVVISTAMLGRNQAERTGLRGLFAIKGVCGKRCFIAPKPAQRRGRADGGIEDVVTAEQRSRRAAGSAKHVVNSLLSAR
ncbi:hypothetical protein BDV95DRAFT_194787 [Massariosphaeria phaeospora]|uniref:Uncharacterized protein n=1 Tax=Massariosphaeria phaeospora TaxID=100035 RepID=A0A7C8I304_9PLEO|nr:hypothetical protein BDV95DRAFT_194787 [Massariosphaeria phaeospora]